MKKLTIVLIIAAAAGGAAWLFGTEKGRKVLGDIKDNLDDSTTKLKSGLKAAKNATADIIEKGKKYMVHSTNNIKKEIVS